MSLNPTSTEDKPELTPEDIPNAPNYSDNSSNSNISSKPSKAQGTLEKEILRRRTFAVISHPDAGKSTLTEALALHARIINEAGAIHGKVGRKSTVSDWMEMEKARGISISSTALQFDYEGYVINLVDTPGHADFSEDTYRVLTAVDAAVMLIDSAKGLEPQTLKLFEVCKYRGIPIITIMNKWDRPGREALELLDEIQTRIGLIPTPLYWPVGIAGDFRGLLDRHSGNYIHFTRTAGGATIAPEEYFSPSEALDREGEAWERAVEESELFAELGQNHSQETFLSGQTTPVIFGSAVLNFGVKQLFHALTLIAPPPSARNDINLHPRQPTDAFSAIVFKVQAGMDVAHRDRFAFMRIVSGEFTRGMVVTHSQSDKPFATKYAMTVVGRERETVEIAYPGDIVGLVNATSLAPGDTLYHDARVEYPPIPAFAPEHFAIIRAKSTAKYKQFRKAIDQLDSEGVVQILRNDIRGEASPVLAAVGPMQFEVVTARMSGEFNVEVVQENLGFEIARKTNKESEVELNQQRGVEVFQRSDGVYIALISDKWRLQHILKESPHLCLDPLIADVTD